MADDRERHPRDGRGEPAWIYVLAGWLLASTQLATGRGPLSGREALSGPEACVPLGALDGASERDPDRMSPRELRALPAIGPARALAIARARWNLGLSGGPKAWEDLPGIGPETVLAIQRSLRERASEKENAR